MGKLISPTDVRDYENQKIDLGSVNANSDICISNEDITSFIFNLFEYALLRDEFRNLIKEK